MSDNSTIDPTPPSTFPPIVIFRGKRTGDSIELMCPFCGCENVHPIENSTNPGGKLGGKVTIDSRGISVDKSIPPEGRGVSIVLRFECEEGHQFRLTFQFSKGATTAVAGDDTDPSHHNIWRD